MIGIALILSRFLCLELTNVSEVRVKDDVVGVAGEVHDTFKRV
jgi:hypothetical protein